MTAFDDWVADAGDDVDVAAGTRPGEYVVVLPGEQKLRTVVSVLVGDRSISAAAFVVRRPDENHENFYRFLLKRNPRMPGVAYGIDDVGDVFVSGRIPVVGATTESIDDLMGAILTAADNAFNKLLELGFATAIRREWAWRVSRGESVENLVAFKHLM